MRFTVIGGLKVYSPGMTGKDCPQKHPCPDCHFCQFCSDARCQTCRTGEKPHGHSPADKLSLAEQIVLYDKINADNQQE